MKYKLVALDLDGTLLNSHKELTEENIEMIKKLTKMGVKFILVTGRPDLMAKDLWKKLELSTPILGCNGASIRDFKRDKIYSLSPFEKSSLKKIYDYFSKSDLQLKFYSLNSVFSLNPHEFDEKNNPFANYSNILAKNINFEVLSNFSELLRKNWDIIKIQYQTLDSEKLVTIQKELKKIKGVEVFRAGKNSLDIHTQNVCKGKALLDFAELEKISAHEIIAIGDSENDISMLKAVGLSIAMKNGDESLKKIANLIAESNNDNGVAKILQKIFFEI